MKKLEICCYTADSAVKAEKAGADRIELCENVNEGGTTPSFGTAKYVIEKLKIPVNVIIRPRGGDFLYSHTELEIMEQDIVTMKKLGANGIVLGALTAKAEINIMQTHKLMRLAFPLEVTFHRAFDMCKNHFKALEDLKKLRVKRILTSGGKNTALEGVKLISELTKKANNEITIMPGSGINENNIEKIFRESGANEFHASAKAYIKSEMQYFNSDISMGKNTALDEYKKISVNADSIKKMIAILNK